MFLHEKYELRVNNLNPRVKSVDDAIPIANLRDSLKLLPPNILKSILDTGVGIEMEVESAEFDLPHKLFGPWKIVGDGSLREGGKEFVTGYGARVGDVFKPLLSLTDAMAQVRKEYPAAFEFSERTSIHIHLDCRFFTESQIESFLSLYTLVENPLFKYAGPDRKHNIFCVPLRDSKISPGHTLNTRIGDWDKYSALNLLALRTFGTLEFRHMSGNSDPLKIYMWIILLALLHNAARRMSKGEIAALITNIRGESQYRTALETLFYHFTDLLQWNDRDIDTAASDAKMFFNVRDFQCAA